MEAGRKVLIVDDHRPSADVIAAMLSSRGHDVRVAYDGPRALEIAAAFHPDVALVDIELPDMDGFEIARRLREAEGDRPLRIVALSGHDLGRGDRLRDAGFDEHVVKPIDLAALDAAVGS